MFDLFSKKNGNLKDDVLSGVTVALLLVPEAIAFSFIAGVNPMVGLWSAVFVGFITAAFGGRPGMICGATGAIAIVAAQAFTLGKKAGLDVLKGGGDLAGLTPDDWGLQYLVAALLFAGAIQITIGLFKLGRFIRLIPHPVMMGFVNGLAIVIALGQLLFFKSTVSFDDNGNMISTWLTMESIGIMGGLIAVTMAIIVLLPKVTKAVPPTLVAIIVVFGLTMFIDGSRDIKDILVMLTGEAKIDSSLPATAIFMQCDSGIDYDSYDGNKVDILFAIFVPEDRCQQYLAALSEISKKLLDKPYLRQLRSADSNESLFKLLQID